MPILSKPRPGVARRRRWGILALAVTLLAVSCGDDDATVTAAPPPDGRVELLDRGDTASGAIVLAPSPAIGQRFDITLRLDQQQWFEGAGAPPRVLAPVLEMDFRGEVVDIGRQASYVTDLEVIDARLGDPGDLGPADVAGLEASLVGLEGMVVRTVTDRNGVVVDQSIELPPGADADLLAQMRNALDFTRSFSVAVPTERVGVGATWTDTFDADLADSLDTSVHTRYRLVAVDGDSYELESSYEQDTSGGLSGVEGTVSGATAGTGRIRGELGRLVPVSSSLEAEGTMDIEVDGTTTRMRLTLEVDLESS